MEIGAIFPQTELSADPGAIREFVQAVEAMGYANLFVADHVLGADTQFHHHPSLASYSYKSVVHEPLTLLGYIAAHHHSHHPGHRDFNSPATANRLSRQAGRGN